MKNLFTKARPSQKKARVLITGGPGNGKTRSALILAEGLGKKIAVIDTEKNSSTNYGDEHKFDTIDYSKWYKSHNPFNYIKLVDMVIENGYDVLIIDSFSHAWEGVGGILELNDEAAQTMNGNTWSAWGKTKKMYTAPLFNKVLMENNLHVICTARTKIEREMQTNSEGKTKIVKMGSKIRQQADIEYEFDLVLDMKKDEEGSAPQRFATVEKTRFTKLFKDDEKNRFVIDEAFANRIREHYKSATADTLDEVKQLVSYAENTQELGVIFKQYPELAESKEFKAIFEKRSEEL